MTKDNHVKLTHIFLGKAVLELLDEKSEISPSALIEQLGFMASQTENGSERDACQQAIAAIVSYMNGGEIEKKTVRPEGHVPNKVPSAGEREGVNEKHYQ